MKRGKFTVAAVLGTTILLSTCLLWATSAFAQQNVSDVVCFYCSFTDLEKNDFDPTFYWTNYHSGIFRGNRYCPKLALE
jgi:hypothetical protein